MTARPLAKKRGRAGAPAAFYGVSALSIGFSVYGPGTRLTEHHISWYTPDVSAMLAFFMPLRRLSSLARFIPSPAGLPLAGQRGPGRRPPICSRLASLYRRKRGTNRIPLHRLGFDCRGPSLARRKSRSNRLASRLTRARPRCRLRVFAAQARIVLLRRGRALARFAAMPRMDIHSWEELTMPERLEITGPAGDRYDEILTPGALDLLVELHDELGERRAELLAARRAAPGRAERRRDAGLPPRDGARPVGRHLAGRATGARSCRPPGRDHRPDRQEDDDQRPELRRERVAGRLRGRQHPAVGEHDRRPAQPHRTRSKGRSTSPREEGKTYALRPDASWPRSSSGRAAGTWRRSTSSSTARRARAA